MLLPSARSHDFLNLYTGASLALDGRFEELHNPAVQLEQERQFYPQRDPVVPFVRPPFYALILAPLALFPYNTAFIVWISVQCLLLIGCWIWGWWRFGPNALVFASFFLPGPLGIGTGQDCLVMLFLFVVAYELTEREHLFAAGCVLALMLIKFHLILLWPVALVLQRRWKMLSGFCAVAAVEAIVSLGLGGVKGARQYWALLHDKSLERLSPSPELMVNFQGLTENLGITDWWASAAVVGAVLLVFVIGVHNAPIWRMFCLTAVASLFVAPHVYAYDATLLLLPILLTIFHSSQPAPRIAATLFSTPVPFGFALAGKPYSIISSSAMVVLLLIFASESLRAPESTPIPAIPREA